MRYKNPHQRKVAKGFVHFLLWRFGYYKEWLQAVPLPADFIYPNPCEPVNRDLPVVTWINHSTFWVQAHGKSILVDPIWNERCSPFPFFGPKRRHPAHPELDDITPLDAIVISHNHYDHLDRYTVKKLQHNHPNALWIMPPGVQRWFHRRFPSIHICELNWWESLQHENMHITSVPAQHFSGRGFFDRNSSHWMGCVIEFEEGKRVYFAGDTGYNHIDFKEIRNQFPDMDLSLIPIGVYKPRTFMKAVHVNPLESVQIHKDVGSKLSVGGHWGTFRLASEEMDRPPFDLYCAMEDAQVPHTQFRVLKPGQSINW
ncbi:MAG: hypothetical protein S4CHLAM2_15710 [Chlamydiales bacterium]|nr:hypothetical protein [Chlamydiales bacterium]